MKYIINVALLSSLFIVGCAVSKSSGSTEASSLKAAPAWFSDPPKSEEVYYATGYAKKQNPALANSTSVGRARDEVSRAVSIEVSNMLQDFMQESGIGDRAEALEFTKTVSEQVSAEVLQGSTIEKQEPGNTGKTTEYYALVKYSLEDAREAALNNAKRQEALYNEFKAEQGFEDLENAIKNKLKVEGSGRN